MPSQAEISARLNGDNSNFRTMMNQSELVADKAGKKIAGKLDIRNASQAMATAVGLNIQTIAENFARLWTGVTKDAEEAFKRIGELADRATELTKRRIELEQTTAQKIQDAQRVTNNLIAERETIYSRIRLEQEAVNKRAVEYQEQVNIGRLSQSKADSLILYLNNQIQLTDKEKVRLAEIKNELLEKEIFLIEKTKQSQKEINAELENFFGDMDKVSSERIQKEQGILEKSEEVLSTQKKQTSEIGKQVEQKEELIEKLEEQKKLEETIISITSTGRGDKDLSDRELERKLQNIKEDIFKRELAQRGMAGLAGSSPYDPLLTEQQFNLQQLLGEIQLREDVRRTARVFGEDAAFNQFNIPESRLREILGNNTEQMKQTSLLEQILDQQRKGIVTVPIGT